MPSETREDYLIRVASLYYEQDYNQEQIAKMLLPHVLMCHAY